MFISPHVNSGQFACLPDSKVEIKGDRFPIFRHGEQAGYSGKATFYWSVCEPVTKKIVIPWFAVQYSFPDPDTADHSLVMEIDTEVVKNLILETFGEMTVGGQKPEVEIDLDEKGKILLEREAWFPELQPVP